MTLGDLIQNIATGSAVFLGITYVIGGLIVNLNLSRRGVVEYQVLKVKYLAVGMIFLFHFIGVVAFTSVPAFLIFLYVRDFFLIQLTSIISVLGSLVLLYVWSRYPPNTKSRKGTWWFWAGQSILSILYPMLILFYQLFSPRTGLESISNLILAVLVGGLAIIAQIYHYSSFYYGRPAGSGVLDPIGLGIPTRVHLLCDEKFVPALAQLGLSIEKNIIHNVYLIDETDVHYIVSKEQVPGGDGTSETYKIDKSLVKVILHKPDHMRQLHGAPSRNPLNPTTIDAPSSGRGLSLWERITHDDRYLRARREIQNRYGLPLPFDVRSDGKKWVEWIEADEKRRQEFMDDVQALFKKFEVPDSWHFDFIADIAGLSAEEEKGK
jgi:hypothetical protein